MQTGSCCPATTSQVGRAALLPAFAVLAAGTAPAARHAPHTPFHLCAAPFPTAAEVHRGVIEVFARGVEV